MAVAVVVVVVAAAAAEVEVVVVVVRQHPVTFGLIPHNGRSRTKRYRFGSRFVIVFVPCVPRFRAVLWYNNYSTATGVSGGQLDFHSLVVQYCNTGTTVSGGQLDFFVLR